MCKVDYVEGSDLRLKVENVFNFCKQNRLGLELRTFDMVLISVPPSPGSTVELFSPPYKPSKPHGDLKPGILHAIYHDNHVVAFDNDALKSLQHSEKRNATAAKLEAPSSRYPLANPNRALPKAEDFVAAASPSQVHACFMEYCKKISEDDGGRNGLARRNRPQNAPPPYIALSVLYNGDMKELYFHLVDNGFHVEVEATSIVSLRRLTIDNLTIDGRYVPLIIQLPVTIKGDKETQLSPEEFVRFTTENRRFAQLVLNEDNLSTLHPEVSKILDLCRPPVLSCSIGPLKALRYALKVDTTTNLLPFNGGTISREEAEKLLVGEKDDYISLDMKKCYPTRLRDLPYIPLIPVFERWRVPPKGHVLDDMYRYIVSFPKDHIVYGHQKYHYIPGWILKKHVMYEIHLYIRVVERPISDIKDSVNRLLSDVDMGDLGKGIINMALGMGGKKVNKKKITRVFRNEADVHQKLGPELLSLPIQRHRLHRRRGGAGQEPNVDRQC